MWPKIICFLPKFNMGFKWICWQIRWKKCHAKKVINEKVTEKGFFNFITVCKNIPPITFLGWFFALFFNRFELSIKVCILLYDNRIKFRKKMLFLLLALTANFKAKIWHVLESQCTVHLFPVWEAPFCQKS